MFHTLKLKFYRYRAIRTLIARYEYLNEVNRVLEEYLTQKILQGGSETFMKKGREDLANKQAEIRETDAMVAFLKTLTV